LFSQDILPQVYKKMLILIEEVGGAGSADTLEEAAANKGFAIATDKPETLGYWVTTTLDALDVIMIDNGLPATPAELCHKSLDTALEKLIPAAAAKGMMLLYNHRYLTNDDKSGIMILVFVLNTDLRSLS
jgi:hypothetical protein